MTSQNIYSLHTPAKRILSDLPPPPRPPPPPSSPSSPRTSNPTPATFLLLLALQQMALSLQTMCPFRNSVLPSASGSKVSEAPRDLPPQQIRHGAAQICIATCRRELRKKTNQNKKNSRFPCSPRGNEWEGGKKNSKSANIHAMQLSSQQLSVPIGSSYGSPYMPPPSLLDLGVSRRCLE